MNKYSSPVVTYIREREEFRVSFKVAGGDRFTVGVCTVGGGWRAESEAWRDAGPAAVAAVNDFIRARISA